MRYKPHSYQQVATQFIIDHPTCALILDMGLGKTVITLTALEELLNETFGAGRVLIIAPLRVAQYTWPAEIAKWDHLSGLNYAVATGTLKQREKALAEKARITIINRENIPWLVENHPWEWDMVIIDELSSFKNHRAKRLKALLKVRPHIRRIVGLTGTPAPAGLLDLWAQYRLLDGGQRLGKYITRYRDKYFKPDKFNGPQVYSWQPLPGAQEQIYAKISDITLSMQAADHLKLPALTKTQHIVQLSKPEARLYDRLRRDMILELGPAEVDAQNAAVLAGKLLQLASGAILSEENTPIPVHNRKLDALEDLVEAANGQSVLVAYWYRHDLDRIQARFKTARDLRSPADFEAWNRGEISVGLIHPAAAGHGLNLQTGGHLLVFYTPTWSLELDQQTIARLYRQGQNQPVTVTYLVTAGSIDEQVLAMLDQRDTTQRALIEAVKAHL